MANMSMIQQRVKRIPLVGPVAACAYRWLTLPSRVVELRKVLHEIAIRQQEERQILDQLVTRQQEEQQIQKLPDQERKLNLEELRTLDRSTIEDLSKIGCQVASLGDGQALCRVLGRYLMFVSTQDRTLAPHLIMNGFWESWITRAIARHVQSGMRVADIGANLGYYSLLLADSVGPDGHLWAFEPNPQLFDLLCESVEINGFHGRSSLLCKACGAQDGSRLALRAPRRSAMNATTAPDAFRNLSDEAVLQFECDTIRLDTALGDNRRLDFVKIDAEGAEQGIWEGMQEVLRCSPHITVAMEFEAKRYPEPRVFLEQIQSSGFALRLISFDSSIQPTTSEQLLENNPDCTMLWLQREQT